MYLVHRRNEYIGMKPKSKLKVNPKTGTKNTLTRKRHRKNHQNPTSTWRYYIMDAENYEW